MVELYGLKVCDTTRAARKWLDAHNIAYRFHDVREDGLTKPRVEAWVKQLGWDKVLNKASTTWRELPDAEKTSIDQKRAVTLMLVHPTLVKRPVLERSGEFTLGFRPVIYGDLFKA